MNVPDFVIESVLGVASVIGVAGFGFLKNRTDKNERAITDLSKEMSSECDDMDKKILDAIEKLGNEVVLRSHCSGKQDLWQERFDSWMRENKVQHDHIGDRVSDALENIDKQLETLFKKIDTKE